LITVRVYKQGSDVVVAACDKHLLGQTFREGELRLTVSPGFYEGEDADEELLVNRLSCCTIANLVGEKVCKIAADKGFIVEDAVLIIGGVPHAQMVRY
jgi:hypothetical protein